MDRKAADNNRNIPEQTESITARMSFLLVSSVILGHILFCSKRIKGVIMLTWYSEPEAPGSTLFHIQDWVQHLGGFRGNRCTRLSLF